MKKGQYSQEKIVALLHQAEKGELTIQAICREHGLTETTFYRWRKIYGGMTVSETHRFKELEKEKCPSLRVGTRLKRLLAESGTRLYYTAAKAAKQTRRLTNLLD